eukprot:NODE_10956_length_482_cov_5.364903_g10302_i0.p1 GENE.NODE_10956_length_482_cov_5.364903_g10302_i0~~NODE_10956_length_482_cov_5.364903_g10302_i0.p1  ORF type:complete len:151 (+),score=24.22 NODE_10956_length_482_cov_5.364903_g10302_i0:40-453(+)
MGQNISNKMAESQKKTQLSLREIQLAISIAQARDLFQWMTAFTATVGTFGIIGFAKTKKPHGIIPLLPLSFVLAYQYDFAYGNKLQRIREEAGNIIREERNGSMKLVPPLGNLLIDEEDYKKIFRNKNQCGISKTKC